MSEERYDLVFKGELVKSFEIDDVKKNIANLFKIDAKKVDALFSGKAVVLKKNLSLDAGNKYRVAIKKAGARVDLVLNQATAAKANEGKPNEDKAHTSEIKSRVTGKAQFGAKDLTPPSSPSSQEQVPEAGSLAGQATAESVPLPQVEEVAITDVPLPRTDEPAQVTVGNRSSLGSSTISLAAEGADVLAPAERTQFVPANIDTSSMSVKAVGENLLNADEYDEAVPLPVDIEYMEMMPVGSDVLKPEERPEIPVMDVDVSGLDIAAPGARLSEETNIPLPVPDVSHISLSDE